MPILIFEDLESIVKEKFYVKQINAYLSSDYCLMCRSKDNKASLFKYRYCEERSDHPPRGGIIRPTGFRSCFGISYNCQVCIEVFHNCYGSTSMPKWYKLEELSSQEVCVLQILCSL